MTHSDEMLPQCREREAAAAEREKAAAERLKRIEEKLDLSVQLLSGNGRPDEGLLARVARIETERSILPRLLGIIAVIISIVGGAVSVAVAFGK